MSCLRSATIDARVTTNVARRRWRTGARTWRKVHVAAVKRESNKVKEHGCAKLCSHQAWRHSPERFEAATDFSCPPGFACSMGELKGHKIWAALSPVEGRQREFEECIVTPWQANRMPYTMLPAATCHRKMQAFQDQIRPDT